MRARAAAARHRTESPIGLDGRPSTAALVARSGGPPSAASLPLPRDATLVRRQHLQCSLICSCVSIAASPPSVSCFCKAATPLSCEVGTLVRPHDRAPRASRLVPVGPVLLLVGHHRIDVAPLERGTRYRSPGSISSVVKVSSSSTKATDRSTSSKADEPIAAVRPNADSRLSRV